MADARYVIDLILRARDDTAAAFASALGNQELFNKALDDSATQADKNADAFRRSNADIQRSTKETSAALRDVKAANKEILDQQVAVERAARQVARTQADQGLSQRERLKRQIEDNANLKKSQADLFALLKEHAIEQKKEAGDYDGLSKKREQAVARAIAQQEELNRLVDNKIRKGRRAAERERDSALDEAHNINAQLQALTKLDAAQTAGLSSDARRVATEKLKIEQLREQEKVIKQLEISSKRFVDTQDAAKARQFSQEIDQQAQALLRLGRSQKEVDELKGGIKTERRDTQFSREKDRIDRETAEATLDLQRTVDAEIDKSRAAREKALIEADRRETERRVQAAKAEIAFERQKEAVRTAAARQDATRGKEVQSVARGREREQEGALRRIRLAAKALSDQKLTPQDFDHFRAELIGARQDFVNLGGDGRRSQEEVRKALDETGASISNEHRARLTSLRGQEEEARQRQEITLATKDYARAIDSAAKTQRDIDRAHKVGATDTLPALERELALRKQAAEVARGALAGKIKDDVVVTVDLDTGQAITQAVIFEAVKRQLGRDVRVNVDVDIAGAAASLAAVDALKASSAGLKKGFDSASGSVSGVGAVLRGFLTLGVVLFLNQIATAGIAAGFALIALAGSAFYAGGALAGGLTAGIAQAIPVLGLLAAAAQRFSKVIEAAKQQQLVDQQQASGADKIAKQQADAVDRVRTADIALADAQRRLKGAQEGITTARRDAVRALQDLILAEREAELAAKGAVLSQKEAQEALQAAISSGDVTAQRRAQLAVEAAPTAIDRANLSLGRTKEDLAGRQSGEPPEVKQAKENIRAATEAVRKAQQASVQARRALAVTGEESISAAGKLDFMLSKMSASERRLFDQVTRLFGAFNGGAISRLTDPIIGAFADVLDKAFGAFDDQAFIGKLIGLSNEIGFQINRIFDRLTSDENVIKFFGFIDDATQNLGPFVGVLLNMTDAFTGIAFGASPIFSLMLDDLEALTAKFSEFVNSADGKNELATFFDEGYKQLKSFIGLLGAFGELFISVVNPDVGGGATAGRTMIDGLANALRQLNKIAQSEEGRKKLQDFFRRTIGVIEALKPLVVDLGGGIEKLFSEQAVRNFRAGVKIFTDVLLPALLLTTEAVGYLTFAFGLFLKIPLAGEILSLVIAFGILRRGMLLLRLIGARFVAQLIAMATRLRLVGLAAASPSAAFRFLAFRIRLAGAALTHFLTVSGAAGLWRALVFRIGLARAAMNNLGTSGTGALSKLRGGIGRLSGSLAGKLGLVGAAALAGFAIGKMLRDNIPLIADMADAIGDLASKLFNFGENDSGNKRSKKAFDISSKASTSLQNSTDPRQQAELRRIIVAVAKAGDDDEKLAELAGALERALAMARIRKPVATSSAAEVPKRAAKPRRSGASSRSKVRTPSFDVPDVPDFSVPDVPIGDVDAGSLARASGKAKTVVNKLAEALEVLTKDGGTLDTIATGIEQFVASRQLKTKLKQFKIGQSGKLIGGESTERGGVNQEITALGENIATQNLALRKYRDEIAQINAGLRKAKIGRNRAKTEAERGRFEGIINSLQMSLSETQTKIADTTEQIVQDKIDLLQKRLDRSLERARGRGLSGPQIESGKKIADALGLTGFGAALSDASIELLKAQSVILKKAIAEARRKGLKDKAKDLQNQLDSLNADIVAAVATQLATAIEAVNSAASRRGAFLGLVNRLADLREKSGDRQGAAASRITTQQATTGSLVTQRAGLLPLLDLARRQGNQKAVEDLTAQIQELTVGILESIQNTKDLVDASRQLSIDLITSARDFKTGLFGGLKGLVDAATASGGPQSGELQESILQGTQAALREGLSGLQGKLAEFGIDVRGQTGADLAASLNQAQQGGQIGAIQASLSGQALETFNNLLNGVISNATELENNTAALNLLNNSIAQTFQSTAWTRFRQALFDGSGGLMPSYSVPTFDTGGEVLRAGIAKVHPGDIAIKGTKPGQTINSGWRGDVKIEVNEAGQPTDARHLASLLAFEMRTMGNRRG